MSTWYFRLLLIVAALGMGSGTTATKYALDGFGPLTMLFVKLAAASAVLWAVLMVRGYKPAPSKWRFALLGLFEPALAYGALTLGLVYTTATNGSLLGATESCFVIVLAAFFLRERMRVRSALGLLLAVSGVFALGGGNIGAGFNAGDLVVLGGSLAAAIYVVLAARIAPTVDAVAMTTYQFTFATVMTLPFTVWVWAVGLESVPASVAPRYWLAVIFIGGISFALGFLLYNRAIRDVPAGLAGVILNMIPVVGVLTAVVFLGESLSIWHVFGGILIVFGIMLFPASKEEVREENTAGPETVASR